MQINLKDGQPRKKGELAVEVRKKGNLIEIGAVGYGECEAAPGAGFPIVLEYYDGKLTLRVFSDINSEAPTHVIPMEGALESKFIDRTSGVKDLGEAEAIEDDPGALVDDELPGEYAGGVLGNDGVGIAGFDPGDGFILEPGEDDDLTGDLIESQGATDAFPDTLEEPEAPGSPPDPQIDLKAARAQAAARQPIGRPAVKPTPNGR